MYGKLLWHKLRFVKCSWGKVKGVMYLGHAEIRIPVIFCVLPSPSVSHTYNLLTRQWALREAIERKLSQELKERNTQTEVVSLVKLMELKLEGDEVVCIWKTDLASIMDVLFDYRVTRIMKSQPNNPCMEVPLN